MKAYKYFSILVFIVIIFSFDTFTYAASLGLDDSKILFQLMNQRLSYMRTVAAYKYLHHLPVNAPSQEHKVINNAVENAKKMHLDTKGVQNLMIIQIQAAKQIEKAWINNWKKNGFPKKDLVVMDLKLVRSNLQNLDQQILRQIVIAEPLLHDFAQASALHNQVINVIDTTYVNDETKLKLLNAVREIGK